MAGVSRAHLLRAIYLPLTHPLLRVREGWGLAYAGSEGAASAWESSCEHRHRSGACSYICDCASVVSVLRASIPAPQRTLHVCPGERRGRVANGQCVRWMRDTEAT